MKHGSLFSGIGGFDLAAQWMGWENVFHCEWNPFGQKILKHYWPKAESFNDITKSDFTKYANTIDILTGGFPCQPYSSAGQRKGKEDERHLWPHMLRAIQEISPRYIVGENVRGLLNWGGDWYSTKCVLTWKITGIKSRPLLFLHVGSAHHTEGKEFGSLLPTPNSSPREVTEEQTMKRKQIYGGNTRAMYLEHFAAMGLLPTPSTRDPKGANSMEHLKRENETVMNHMTQLPNYIKYHIGTNSQLNPRFVAEMMGFPVNWMELPFQSGEPNQSKH